jgi:arylsulfatase A
MDLIKKHLAVCVTLTLLLAVPAASDAAQQGKKKLPNIVVVFVDDMGYGDVGCFGGKIKTPNLDRMAKQGVRLNSFYVSQAVCSASRAAILTGCYSNRVSIQGALGPNSKHGLGRQELTIAELVKPLGYATAIIGKWHLGHLEKHLPKHHGFDEYYGLPYSNDMWPKHPTAKFPPLPLIKMDKIIEYDPDQTKLTTEYTEKAVDFINRNKGGPFFLYLAHSMPHVPLFVSDRFKGKSDQGLYGDVIMELDWSVGQVMEALQKNGIEEDTLVIFTSDNGPWLSYGNHGGSAGPLREGKGTSWEGGVRVPFIACWPGHIPANKTNDEPAMTIDLLPTIARLTGGKLPAHKIDGKDIWPLLAGEPGAKSPHEAYFFYWGTELQGVRSGKWKLYFPHQYRTLAGKPGGKDGQPAQYQQARIELALFDLSKDISEKNNVVNQHPAVVQQLQKLADGIRDELGDKATKTTGKGVREPEK